MIDSASNPTVRCSACGQPNDAGARFCADCGARLPDNAPTEAWPAPAGGIQLPVATRVVHVGPGGAAGAGIALAGIFLPGFLLLIGVLPFWNRLQHHERVQAIMRGANAAVVGILAAALYTPVFTTAILTPPAFALALVCFVLLVAWKLPPWIVVIIGAAGGILATTLT